MKNTLNITIENYASDFVAKLAKSPYLILHSLVPVDAINFDVYMAEDSAEASRKIHLLHMAIGVSGEVAEFLESLQVLNGDLDAEDAGSPIEELGDMLFYMVGMASELDTRTDWSSYLLQCESYPEDLVIASGKLLDAVKKYVIYNKADAYNDVNVLWAEVMSHIAVAIEATVSGGLEDVIDHNVEKLSSRYKNLTYSDQAAQVRADKQ